MAKAKCRFVVDENSLMLDRVPAGEREAEIESMIGELQALQEGGERVDILSGWGSISCLEGEDVADILAHGNVFDRDSSSLLLRLLGRCGAWDEDPTTVVDDKVVVDQEPHNSFGIAWAQDGHDALWNGHYSGTPSLQRRYTHCRSAHATCTG